MQGNKTSKGNKIEKMKIKTEKETNLHNLHFEPEKIIFFEHTPQVFDMLIVFVQLQRQTKPNQTKPS